ncbi:MAG: UDP-GlcNAc:undecaprenyl-phosphate/decaprenyl-phosphate GlcNAc-phosphate transferase [Patescibacteria group bacterium]|nr:UDP-GlcNAc:undecaprenyl-phosphate/decaprenyl-phosphate GlcNAc-phosphate transferase [Patescibacteria group bacterium]
MIAYFFPFLISFSLAIIFTLLIKKIALRFSIVDKPGPRKIHKKATPLLGGVAIFLAFFLTLFIFSKSFLAGNLEWQHLLGFFFGGLIIIIGGILDDKYNLAPKWQFIFPLLAILAVIMGGVTIEKITNPLGGLIYLQDYFLLGPLLISLWLLGMMYTTKLLDGVDGLVTGVGAIGSIIIFLFTLTTNYYQPDIALAALILAAAALGFLIFNFHPAKIFLGEGGSLFLGYALGVLSIISGSKIAIALLIMGIPILDVAWTIIRRLLVGKNPFRFADKKHLHHRLLALGLNQRQTVFVFYSLSLIFGVSGLFLQSRGKLLALAFLLFLMIITVSFFHYLDYTNEKKKPKLLLHVCCAPCASYISYNYLVPAYRLTWFFYNPNLTSLEEYNKRLYYVKKMAKKFHIPLVVVPYEHEKWLKKVEGHEMDPEKGERCLICYFDRLEKTAQTAQAEKFDYFSTSLLYSPYKNIEALKEIGKKLEKKYQTIFLDNDYSAENAYHNSQEFAKSLGMYRQKFCGCEFSIRKNKHD